MQTSHTTATHVAERSRGQHVCEATTSTVSSAMVATGMEERNRKKPNETAAAISAWASTLAATISQAPRNVKIAPQIALRSTVPAKL